MKEDFNWGIERVLLYRLRNPPSIASILPVSKCLLRSHHEPGISVPLFAQSRAQFALLWVASVTYITLRFYFQISKAAEKTMVFPCCFTKRVHFWILQDWLLNVLEIWQVLITKTNMEKLESFLSSPCVGLQFLTLCFQKSKWKILGLCYWGCASSS